MKKTLILSVVLAACFAAMGFCKPLEEPETAPALDFDGAANTTVIDALPFSKTFNDRMRVISAVDGPRNFILRIYRAKKSAWEVFGTAEITGFADRDFVDSDKKAGKCRWVAITPVDGGDFIYEPAPDGTDLFITVLPKKELIDSASKARATIFENSAIKGVFKDDITVVNKSSTIMANFSVFAFNDQNEPWKKMGDFQLKSAKNNEKTVYSPYKEDITNYKYYAIVSDGNFQYSAAKVKKNLVITATDK